MRPGKPERHGEAGGVRAMRDIQLATFNILEDFGDEKTRLEQTQRAVLNILEDFENEKTHLELTQKATINILEDFTSEKHRLEELQRAVLNILEDGENEKAHLELTQKATFNILEDFNAEKQQLEDTQRAVLNILEDFELEKTKVESAKEELQTAHDILEAKVEERTMDLRNSLQEKEVLIKEIYHRTKNNMHIITNLISLQMYSMNNQDVREKMKDLQSRIQAMALVHEKLYKRDLSRLDLKDYVTDLARALVSSFIRRERNIDVELSLDSSVVSIDTAIPCGLIINELVSNCLKYAFTAGKPGLISLGLTDLGESGLELRVADNGGGLPEELDVSKASSLGLKIVYNLVRQLMGTVEARNRPEGGAEFVIRLCKVEKV